MRPCGPARWALHMTSGSSHPAICTRPTWRAGIGFPGRRSGSTPCGSTTPRRARAIAYNTGSWRTCESARCDLSRVGPRFAAPSTRRQQLEAFLATPIPSPGSTPASGASPTTARWCGAGLARLPLAHTPHAHNGCRGPLHRRSRSKSGIARRRCRWAARTSAPRTLRSSRCKCSVPGPWPATTSSTGTPGGAGTPRSSGTCLCGGRTRGLRQGAPPWRGLPLNTGRGGGGGGLGGESPGHAPRTASAALLLHPHHRRRRRVPAAGCCTAWQQPRPLQPTQVHPHPSPSQPPTLSPSWPAASPTPGRGTLSSGSGRASSQPRQPRPQPASWSRPTFGEGQGGVPPPWAVRGEEPLQPLQQYCHLVMYH